MTSRHIPLSAPPSAPASTVWPAARAAACAATATAALAAALAGSAARAQPAPANAGVEESTDPARVAAVEQAAQALKARQAADAGAGPSAPTPVRGTSASGVAFVCGGVTGDERLALHAERARWSLWVATVARPSGAYLSDARLRIAEAASKRVVLERTMDGPWCFVALPPGRYEVSATLAPAGPALPAPGAALPQVQRELVGVASSGPRQAVLRFDVADEVGAESPAAPKWNPFGDAAPGR